RLCLDHPEHDARLVVVGDGPERASLSLAARSLGLGDRLILTGQVSDPRPYYLAADVMALPSLIEGSPNVLLEAMAAGLPIVATRVGGVPEIISDGLTGLLAEPADFESFSSALNLVLSNTGLSRTLAQNARAVARTSYAPAARARALVDIYRELVPAIRPIHSNSLGVWQTTNRMRHGRHDNGIARTGFGARTSRRSVARRAGAARPDQDNAASLLASHQNEIGQLQNAHNGRSVSSKVSRALLVKVKHVLYFLYL